MGLNLGCAEHCLPGAALEEKLRACREHKLWLELVNKGERDLEILGSYDVKVKTVQAFLLHKISLVGVDRAERRAAREHVKNTIATAALVGAEHVLVVPSYGREFVKSFREEFAGALRDIASNAKENGITVLIEALSPLRTSFLPSLGEVSSFIAGMNLDNLALAADTGHAFDAREEVLAFKDRIAELHLKDTQGRAPGRGGLDFAAILKGHFWPQLCLEYRSNKEQALVEALDHIKSIFQSRRGRP